MRQLFCFLERVTIGTHQLSSATQLSDDIFVVGVSPTPVSFHDAFVQNFSLFFSFFFFESMFAFILMPLVVCCSQVHVH